MRCFRVIFSTTPKLRLSVQLCLPRHRHENMVNCGRKQLPGLPKHLCNLLFLNQSLPQHLPSDKNICLGVIAIMAFMVECALLNAHRPHANWLREDHFAALCHTEIVFENTIQMRLKLHHCPTATTQAANHSQHSKHCMTEPTSSSRLHNTVSTTSFQGTSAHASTESPLAQSHFRFQPLLHGAFGSLSRLPPCIGRRAIPCTRTSDAPPFLPSPHTTDTYCHNANTCRTASSAYMLLA